MGCLLSPSHTFLLSLQYSRSNYIPSSLGRNSFFGCLPWSNPEKLQTDYLKCQPRVLEGKIKSKRIFLIFFYTYIHGESAMNRSNVPVTRSPGVYSRDGLIAISPIIFPLTAVIRLCIGSKSSCRWYCLSKSRDFQRFTAAIRGRCAWNNIQCMLDKSLITRGWPQVYARRLKSVGSNQIRGFLDTFWANQLSLIWDFLELFWYLASEIVKVHLGITPFGHG